MLALSPCRADAQPHVDTARHYIGTRETSGNNRSPVIDRWNRFVGALLGSPWCGSCVSKFLFDAGVDEPDIRSARARAFITRHSIDARDILRGRYHVKKGDLIIWRRAGGGGHIGIAAADWLVADGRTLCGPVLEGNTSSGQSGSQWNGDGYWLRWRCITASGIFRITHVTPVHYSTDGAFLTPTAPRNPIVISVIRDATGRS